MSTVSLWLAVLVIIITGCHLCVDSMAMLRTCPNMNPAVELDVKPQLLTNMHYCFIPQVPITVVPGSHKLTVEGLINDGYGQPIFRNETEVHFETKYVSLFVTTDRPVYYPPGTGTVFLILYNYFLCN